MSERSRVVLVIEDDPEIRYLMTAVLSADDREICTAETGAEAERLLAERPFDLVVLDLILPDTDGRTLLGRLRERPESATVPVAVVSSRGGVEIRQECYALGADHFVAKPFDPESFVADVDALLRRSGASAGRPVLADPVSGLPNRAGLAAAFGELPPGSGAALVQLDGLLGVSDRWGWSVAEEMLREVGRTVDREAGDEATTGRLGGGEFAILSAGVRGDALVDRCGAILETVRSLELSDPQGEPFRLTASVGVVDVPDQERDFDAVLGEARGRLFRAPGAGRNRVVTDDQAEDAGALYVLVAEDDEISATILLHRLEKEGLEVAHYDNGKQAYEAALERTPDLVILDVKMPGMGGFEVLDRLRRSPSFTHVPIIMLTSMGGEADVVRGFKLGADDYMLKPFSPVELSARVWRLLRRGRPADGV